MPADWGKLRRLERIAETGDFRLPSTAPHYYPAGGFNQLFDQMLDGFDVRIGTRVERIEGDHRGSTIVVTDAGALHADIVISTAPIDGLLGYRFGPLEWRGYRIEPEVIEDAEQRELGRAPDGIPFAWVYTPWPETPACRTTDFGVIHQGPRPSRPAVLLREIVDDSVPMYPVWWENDRFGRYLEEAVTIQGLIPLGRLGLYKYVTVDSTFAMVERLLRLPRGLPRAPSPPSGSSSSVRYGATGRTNGKRRAAPRAAAAPMGRQAAKRFRARRAR